MSRIFDRYLLREALGASLAVTGVLMLVFLCNRFARVLGEAAAGELPRDAVFTLLGLSSVYYVIVLAPIGLFLGIMLALGRLYRDSEMTAMSACGTGPMRVLRPLMLLAVVVAGLLAWLCLDIAPWAQAQALATKMAAQREAEIGILDPGRFKSADDGRIVFYAERVTPDGALENVFIQRREGDAVQVAVAARGEQRRDPATGVRTMVLYDGQRFEGVPGTTDFRILDFAEHGIPIMTRTLAAQSDEPATRPTAALVGSSDPREVAELQWRFSAPLAAILLTILAVPLARTNPRQGRYGKVLIAVLAYIVYANLLAAARVWVEQERVPYALGLWWVHGLLLVIGVVLMVTHSRVLGLRAPRVPAT